MAVPGQPADVQGENLQLNLRPPARNNKPRSVATNLPMVWQARCNAISVSQAPSRARVKTRQAAGRRPQASWHPSNSRRTPDRSRHCEDRLLAACSPGRPAAWPPPPPPDHDSSCPHQKGPSTLPTFISFANKRPLGLNRNLCCCGAGLNDHRSSSRHNETHSCADPAGLGSLEYQLRLTSASDGRARKTCYSQGDARVGRGGDKAPCW